MELGIDTSSDMINLALSNEGQSVVELAWMTRQNHTVEVLSALTSLLERAGLDVKLISAVFVAKGPGSFNGLRVGLSIAKGLAFALEAPIIGVSTLEMEAYPFCFTGLPVYPVHDAGRDEVATAEYRILNGKWSCLQEEHITTLEELINGVQEKSLFCGELSEKMVVVLEQRLEEMAVIPDAAARSRRGRQLSVLGWRRLKSGTSDEMATLQPLYLRRPHISQAKPRWK